MDDGYCKGCNLHFVDPADSDAALPFEQEDIEIERLLEKRTNIKKREKVSIVLIIVGILLASLGSVVLDMKLAIWLTGALVMSVGLFSLLDAYSSIAHAEVRIRTIEARKNRRIRRSDTHVVGDLFEAYVADLFSPREYTFLEVTPRRGDLNGRYIAAALNPDFRIRYEPNGHIIWVECKYRSGLYKGKLEWCKEEQFERYRRFQREHWPEKVYVVIGLGGQPDDPGSLFCIPLIEIASSALEPSLLEPNRMRSPGSPFVYRAGRLTWDALAGENRS